MPVEPAAFSVWQPPQPAEAKTALPAVAIALAPVPARSWWERSSSRAGAVVVGAVRRRRAVVVAVGSRRLLRVLVEEEDGGDHRDEERDADDHEPAEVLAGEVRVAPRQDERRDERERDEREADAGEPDLVAVDRPATTSAIVESIGAGTYRN